MNTIKNNAINEMIIKNSRFITALIKINCKEEVSSYLRELKDKYPKATHYCYAYILLDDKKSSDDGEPNKTAGLPILNVLEKENLTNILVVVIRYFGGIKLGAGGLIRAYSNSVSNALKKSIILNLIPAKKIKVIISYEQNDHFLYKFRDSLIIEQKFLEQIVYVLIIKTSELNKLNNYSYQVLDDTWIEE